MLEIGFNIGTTITRLHSLHQALQSILETGYSTSKYENPFRLAEMKLGYNSKS